MVFYTVLPENAGDRRIREREANVIKRALSPVISPGWILSRHSDCQFSHFLLDTRSGNPFPQMAIVPLFRHQLTMPTHNRVGRDDAGQFAKCPASKRSPLHR